MITPSPFKKQSSSSLYKSFIKDFITGGVAGSIMKTIFTPFENVKMQLLIYRFNPNSYGKQFNSVGDFIWNMYKEQGILAFWRGNCSKLIRYFPLTAINFSVKDAFQKAYMEDIDPNLQKTKFFIGNFLSGGFAGAISLIFVYPIDYTRIRLAQEGLNGMYRGFGIAVIGIFVYRAFYFGGYDSGKEWIFGNREAQKKVSFLAKLLFAQIIAFTSEVISFPIDTVRKRLIMQNKWKIKEGVAKKYSGIINCFSKILQEEGIHGFFKGNLFNFNFSSLRSSLVLVLYDKLKLEWFSDYNYQF